MWHERVHTLLWLLRVYVSERAMFSCQGVVIEARVLSLAAHVGGTSFVLALGAFYAARAGSVCRLNNNHQRDMLVRFMLLAPGLCTA